MSMYDVLVYLFFNTLSIHVKLMNEMQIDKIQKNDVANQQQQRKKKPEWREGDEEVKFILDSIVRT